ncbi:MAG: hypothetical protein CVU88_00165 [Firmicutes bacterium HGW-Firmicutes-13]|nr:MAG: hypothetical protein CVU88_00165 [Firmicutes bacterium HGW-Firmicutes-13]
MKADLKCLLKISREWCVKIPCEKSKGKVDTDGSSVKTFKRCRLSIVIWLTYFYLICTRVVPREISSRPYGMGVFYFYN